MLILLALSYSRYMLIVYTSLVFKPAREALFSYVVTLHQLVGDPQLPVILLC